MIQKERSILRKTTFGKANKIKSYAALREIANDFARDYDRQTIELEYSPEKILLPFVLPQISSEDRIVDIGCGTGRTSKELLAEGFCVDGMDLSPQMLKIASKKGYNKLLEMDIATCTPPEELKNLYDCLISAGMFGDFVPIDLLGQVLPLLKNQGIIAIGGEFSERKAKKISLQNKLEIGALFQKHTYYKHGRFPTDYTYLIATKN